MGKNSPTSANVSICSPVRETVGVSELQQCQQMPRVYHVLTSEGTADLSAGGDISEGLKTLLDTLG